MSTNRPSAKPKIGAGDRAGDEAGERHQQRRQVGGDAEDRDLRDGAELEDPAEQAEQHQPDHGRRRDRHLASLQVGVGLGQDLDDVQALQVGGGLDVDALVEVAVAEVDPRAPCRSGSRRG